MSNPGLSLTPTLAEARLNRKTGKKAEALSLLIEAGYSVPRGFVISTDAYRSHLWASGARELTAATAGPGTLERIHSAILCSVIPTDVQTVILDAYKRLALLTGEAEPEVSVRPSAVEDNAGDGAFPEAYSSFLNVCGSEPLLEAVKRTWASLWSEKASELRKGAPGSNSSPAMAVIVQQMIRADWHVQVFTADPASGDPRRVFVTCRRDPGLHSAGADFSCLVNLADLSFECTGESVGPDPGVLTFLAERSVMAEEILDGKIVMDWAIEGERLWVLQARPLDRLPVFFPSEPAAVKAVELRLASSAPVSHFAESLANSRARSAGCPPGAATVINGYVYVPTPFDSDTSQADPNRARRVISEWERLEARDIVARARRLVRLNLGDTTPRELSEFVADAALNANRAVRWLERLRWEGVQVADGVRGMIADTRAAALLPDLFGGIEDPAVSRDARLQDLAEQLAVAESRGKIEDGAWWTSFKREVESFAREFGFCFRDTSDMYDPGAWQSWIEDDEPVLRTVAALMRQHRRQSVVTLHCAAARRAEEARAEAATALTKRARAVFRQRLELARRCLAAMGEAEQVCALSLTSLRLVALQAGCRLSRCARIAARDDVWQLSLEEILRALISGYSEDLRPLVAERRHIAWLRSRLDPPKRIPLDGNRDSYSGSPQTAVLRGRGVSPGIVVGKACVADNIRDASEIEAGDILVVRSLTPAWTPFLALAAGVVTEDDIPGWNRAHLVRDYGTPAVFDCTGVLSRAAEKRRLKIDGSEGLVDL